jgi:hypothetical protein
MNRSYLPCFSVRSRIGSEIALTVVSMMPCAIASHPKTSLTLPPLESFKRPDAFYSVMFHELGRSTGHKSRLAREGVTDPQRFGNHEYSKEELIAEMSASFLRAFAGIDTELLVDDSAAYLASWLRVLPKDSRMVVFAAAATQKAVDWIVGKKAPDEAESHTDMEPTALLPWRSHQALILSSWIKSLIRAPPPVGFSSTSWAASRSLSET